MTGDPLLIRTAECRSTSTSWRRTAEWATALAHDVQSRCDGALLGEWVADVRFPCSVMADELGRAADLLAATVRAVELVGFDATSTPTAGDLLVVLSGLQAAVRDGHGAYLVDADDPAPDRTAVTAHLGYVPLFGDGGPRPTDVSQGSLGDCWILAAVSAVAGARPDLIESMVVDRGDGTYAVTIDGDVVVVDDEFPVDLGGHPLYAGGPSGADPAVLWPLVIEKALAQRGGGGYEALSGDDPDRALDLFGDTDGMSLSQRGWFDPSEAEVLDRIDDVLDAGGAVTASAGGVFGMGARHVWSVVRTGTDDAGAATVTIRNPWGRVAFEVDDGVVERTTANPATTGLDADDVVIDDERAELTLPLEDFVDGFDELDVVTGWDD